MREPVGYLVTEKFNGRKDLRFQPPADLPYNREHWEWEPVYVGNDDPAGLPSRDSCGLVSVGPDQPHLIMEPEGWQPIKTAPKNEMFIWAKRKADGLWSIGLAYQSVSGGWADSYGEPTDGAVLWHPLPSQPDLLNTTERR